MSSKPVGLEDLRYSMNNELLQLRASNPLFEAATPYSFGLGNEFALILRDNLHHPIENLMIAEIYNED